jgi:hypothetical protein
VNFSSRSEARAIIDAAQANGECVLLNIVGALVGPKDGLLHAFRGAVAFRRALGDFEIMSVHGDKGIPALGFDVNTSRGCYLYGVAEEELMLCLADMSGAMQ